jgi:hypothetical protein
LAFPMAPLQKPVSECTFLTNPHRPTLPPLLKLAEEEVWKRLQSLEVAFSWIGPLVLTACLEAFVLLEAFAR